jgi:hypothetical protein
MTPLPPYEHLELRPPTEYADCGECPVDECDDCSHCRYFTAQARSGWTARVSLAVVGLAAAWVLVRGMAG